MLCDAHDDCGIAVLSTYPLERLRVIGDDTLMLVETKARVGGSELVLLTTHMLRPFDMGSLQRLPRIIGQGHARELAFTGKDIDADRALRIGLVSDVYEDEAAVLAAARTMANEIAEASPIAVQGIKQVMSYGDERAVLDAERYVAVWNAAFLASNDLVEAIQSFMEKRPAKFTGK
jgi:enoyl-CoA hydratase/carnithine racemase